MIHLGYILNTRLNEDNRKRVDEQPTATFS